MLKFCFTKKLPVWKSEFCRLDYDDLNFWKIVSLDKGIWNNTNCATKILISRDINATADGGTVCVLNVH